MENIKLLLFRTMIRIVLDIPSQEEFVESVCVWLMAGLSSLTWPESDRLDSGAR